MGRKAGDGRGLRAKPGIRLKKILSRVGGWVYHAVFTGPGLRAVQRSLGTQNEKTAWRKANELQREGMLWSKVQGAAISWSLSDLYERFLVLMPERGVSARAVDRQAWASLIEICGDLRCSDLGRDEVDTWLASYSARQLSGETAKCHCLRAALIWRVGCALPSPFAGVKVKRDRVKGRRRPFSLSQIEEVLAGLLEDDALDLGPAVYPLALLVCETGLRLGDGCKLRWDSVDLAKRSMTVRISKTGGEVVLPVGDELLELFGKMRRRGEEFVWPALVEEYSTAAGRHRLTARLRRVVSRLGWQRKIVLPGRARPLSILNWHSFRHAFVQRLCRAGVAASTIQAMTGHKSLDMVVHYSQEVALEDKLAALRLISRNCRNSRNSGK